MDLILKLPHAMWEEIIQHAREDAPRECCGVIIGPPGECRELRRMTNTYEGIDFYEVDGRELLDLSKEVDQRDWGFTAIYHSHPVSQAYPSARDREFAFYPDTVYLICSLEIPDAPVIRGFFIDGDEAKECAISVVDSS
jgi:proteasome lid subunit RPN8/RPN11